MIEKEKRKRGRPKVHPAVKAILKAFPGADKIKNREDIPKVTLRHGNKIGAGRPPGAKNKSTLMFEQIGLKNAEAVYNKVIELALAGDIAACKIVLDRAYPTRKGRNIDLQFVGPIKTIQDANRLSEHITTMIITGEISAEEAEDYGKWIDRRMKSIIDSDVMDKMDATVEKVSKLGK